jgi:hypothetical protein
VLTQVWQKGYGSRHPGIPATATIPAWMSLIVFAVLFGPSMDYEVFILSRIREEYDRTGSADATNVMPVKRAKRAPGGAERDGRAGRWLCRPFILGKLDCFRCALGDEECPVLD